jgi:hypothetical protein
MQIITPIIPVFLVILVDWVLTMATASMKFLPKNLGCENQKSLIYSVH